jgi:hypothetical protein
MSNQDQKIETIVLHSTINTREVVDAPVVPDTVSAAPVASPIGTVVAKSSDAVGTISTAQAISNAKAPKASTSAFTPEVQELIAQMAANSNVAAVSNFSVIENYINDMAPGKSMDEQFGSRHQVLLFRAIQSIINGDGKDFPEVFATLLKIFADNSKGVFSAQYAFRFVAALPLNKDDLEGFLRIVNLLTVTGPVQSRALVVKTIDLKRALQYGVNEAGVQRISSFFNV